MDRIEALQLLVSDVEHRHALAVQSKTDAEQRANNLEAEVAQQRVHIRDLEGYVRLCDQGEAQLAAQSAAAAANASVHQRDDGLVNRSNAGGSLSNGPELIRNSTPSEQIQQSTIHQTHTSSAPPSVVQSTPMGRVSYLVPSTR